MWPNPTHFGVVLIAPLFPSLLCVVNVGAQNSNQARIVYPARTWWPCCGQTNRVFKCSVKWDLIEMPQFTCCTTGKSLIKSYLIQTPSGYNETKRFHISSICQMGQQMRQPIAVANVFLMLCHVPSVWPFSTHPSALPVYSMPHICVIFLNWITRRLQFRRWLIWGSQSTSGRGSTARRVQVISPKATSPIF